VRVSTFPILYALIAQLVEQLICNHQVRRSSRRGGTRSFLII
jgi:hypothetical protein